MIYQRRLSDYAGELVDSGKPFKCSTLAVGKYYFDDSGSDVHAFMKVMGYLVHVNLTTGDYYISSQSDTVHGLPFNGYAFYNDKLFFGINDHLYAYDLAGGLTLLHDIYPEGIYSGNIGSDGMVYIGCTKSIIQVNPTDNTHVVISDAYHPDHIPGECDGVASDGTYLYCVWKISAAYAYISVYKLSDGSKTYIGEAGGYSAGAIQRCSDGGGKWQAYLGSNYWDCAGGVCTPASGGTAYPFLQNNRASHYTVNQNYPDNNDGNLVAWNIVVVDADLVPWDGNLSPKFFYKNPGDSEDYTELAVEFPANPSTDAYNIRVMPVVESTHEAFILGSAGSYPCFMAKYNYIDKTISAYNGSFNYSVYSVGRVAANDYVIGTYPNAVVEYDATSPWTWTVINPTGGNPRVVASDSKWMYFGPFLADDGYYWWVGEYRDVVNGWVNWWRPSDDDHGHYASDLSGTDAMSGGVAANRSKILAGMSNKIIKVFDTTTKDLDKNISTPLSGYYNDIIVADYSAGNDVLLISTDNSTNHVLISLNIDTEVVNWDKALPAGTPFGPYNTGLGKVHRRFPIGPDGNYYILIGTNIYGVDTDGNFTDLGDIGQYGLISFSGKDVLLNHPSGTTLYSIQDFFDTSYPNSKPLGIEGGQPGGMPGGKVDGI